MNESELVENELNKVLGLCHWPLKSGDSNHIGDFTNDKKDRNECRREVNVQDNNVVQVMGSHEVEVQAEVEVKVMGVNEVKVRAEVGVEIIDGDEMEVQSEVEVQVVGDHVVEVHG